jgi:hypothetical protein
MENSFYYIIGFCLLLYYGWKRNNDEEKAEKAREKIKRDTKFYNYMKQGLKEYRWKTRNDDIDIWFDAKDKAVLFENIDVIIYKVDHFIEYRLGFYIKDTQEYGLYTSCEDFEMYKRSNSSFTEENFLYTDDD